MRQRFRVQNQFFAAETFTAAEGFEVRVFPLDPSDNYFKHEAQKPLIRLRGADEQELLRQAMLQTRSLVDRKATK